ncbi:MAG: Spy/CpxP family protein refolding chaperone, partial [Candidatus Methylomirabilales bacterium]
MARRWLMVLFLVTVFGMGGSAFAHPPFRPMVGHRMMGGHALERPLISFMLQHREELNLSAEQVKALETLRSEFQKEAVKKHADLEVAEIELRGLEQQEPVDLGAIEAKVRQIEALKTELRLSRIRTIAKGKEVLQPEQRKKLEELERTAPAHGMRGRGMMTP